MIPSLKLKIFFISLMLYCITFSCKSKQDKQNFPLEWTMVNDSIKNNWDKYSGNSNNIPHPFAYAFWDGLTFYWDTYFTQIGLVPHDRIDLIEGGAANLKWLLDSLKFIPNASADWGDNRSQPPYFSMMVNDIYKLSNDTAWLRKYYHSLLTEYHFWTHPDNTIEDNHTSINGLQRYYHHASARELFTMYNDELSHRFGLALDIDSIKKLDIASDYAAEAETGMDFTPRFENRCPDFVAVDLNANLYLYEINFAFFESELGISDGAIWITKANERKKLINQYCWSEERGLYLDYDFINKRHSKVAAATAFSPMYAGLASPEQAKKLVANLNLFLSDFGITTCEKSKQERSYQWDHESVWPPMQSITIIALDNYNYKKEANEICIKYMNLVSKNFIQPSPAQYLTKTGDTIQRKKYQVYEKYLKTGEINDREYTANIMYGWSAATFSFAYNYFQLNN